MNKDRPVGSPRDRLNVYVVIPNLNGARLIADCLASLENQSLTHTVVVVDNGSEDGSAEFIVKTFPCVVVLRQAKNHGFAGGVNLGIRYALAGGATHIALFNNDAVAGKDWLERLADGFARPDTGIVTGKFLKKGGGVIDSVGDEYSVWGLPYPRGRGETDRGQYDEPAEVFGATGGASLYSAAMLKDIGLFDERFFAYFEDVDISFRARLAGWRVRYRPDAVSYHVMGATSGRLQCFFRYHALKNLPMLFYKNVPLRWWPRILPRFLVLYAALNISALRRGQILPVLKAQLRLLSYAPGLIASRVRIQKSRTAPLPELEKLLLGYLPPGQRSLSWLRRTVFFWRTYPPDR
ncbi:MAG TPA: glycosyltransferase family 2 protein [Elusimicrobia bacterium]|nr:glycosyltransferase family 2 protein [Elusimicrobiota bacterium]